MLAALSSAGTVDSELATVAAIHGGAGPWVVAGYRMGEYAMKQLGLDRYSFDLEVQHHTPHKVSIFVLRRWGGGGDGREP